MNAAVLTVSDGVFHGERQDESGDVLAAEAEGAGFTVVARARRGRRGRRDRRAGAGVVRRRALLDVALVLVTGGTGFAPRDVTPEALSSVYERRAPGLDEAMRAASMQVKPHGMLTRGVSGTRGSALVISFPGSPRACRENFAVVAARPRPRAAAAARGPDPPPVTDAALYARRFSSLVRLEHSLFALPYAYVGALLAVDGWPGLANLVWITVAMVGARSLAMALNRLIDARIDAANPRTARRELPSGLLSRAQVWAFCLVALAGAAGRRLAARRDHALAVADPRRDVRDLPLPQARHAALPPRGWAPASAWRRWAAWVAVTDEVPWQPFLLGAVGRLLGRGLRHHLRHDGPGARPPERAALAAGRPRPRRGRCWPRASCTASPSSRWSASGWSSTSASRTGRPVAICAVLLAYENSLVKPDDLSRVNAAFFNVNAILAAIYLAGVALDVAIRS